MRKIRRLVNGLVQRTCTASFMQLDGLMHNLRGRPHAYFVYGIMHFYVETLMQALSTVHVHGCICIKCNIYNTQHSCLVTLYLAYMPCLTTPVGLLVTPTDRPKSVRNCCVIEVFGGVCVCCPLVFEFSVGIGVFVIGLGQISFFFSLYLHIHNKG